MPILIRNLDLKSTKKCDRESAHTVTGGLWKAVVDAPCNLHVQRVVEDVGLLVYVYNAL